MVLEIAAGIVVAALVLQFPGELVKLGVWFAVVVTVVVLWADHKPPAPPPALPALQTTYDDLVRSTPNCDPDCTARRRVAAASTPGR